MGKTYDVACVGLQVIDLLAVGVDAGAFERESTTAESVTLALGGDALNQAIALSRLGSHTALLGTVGDDRLGDTLLALLGEYPLDVYDRRVKSRTSISVVLIDPGKERHFLRQPGHNDVLCFSHLDQEAVRRAHILSIGGAMALPNLDGEGMRRLLTLARASDTVSCMDFRINRVDCDREDMKATLALADFLLPSEGEAAWLSGEKESPRHMAQALRHMGAKNVVIKLGERGCYLNCAGEEGQIPACKARLVDATGAGDNFTAAFLHALRKGFTLWDCARFACAAGAIAVEKLGANGAIESERQVLGRMRAAYP